MDYGCIIKLFSAVFIKSSRNDIAEIRLKVALNTITLLQDKIFGGWYSCSFHHVNIISFIPSKTNGQFKHILLSKNVTMGSG
jgi:hypothetical protein